MGRFDLRDLFRRPTPQQRIDALQLRPDLARAAVVLVADDRTDAQVARLEWLLEPDESVLVLVEGRSQRQLGLLMLSTRRVLFRPHGEGAPAVSVLPLSELSDVESATGSMTGRLVLRSNGAVLEVDKLLGTLADQFVAAVRAQQHAADSQDRTVTEVSRDPLAELVELRSQYEAGAVSTADYEVAKARLIREI